MEKFDIYDDLYRYSGDRKYSTLLRYLFFTPGFTYIYFLRKTQNSKSKGWGFLYKIALRLSMYIFGIQIPYETRIGRGFRIVHFGNIVINPNTVIGENFNISNGVTIGSSQGKRAGTPVIGNNVCISANAVVIGNIRIGNDVLIAPNAFVNIDIPDGCIALGNPAKIISANKASSKYIVYKLD